MHVQNPARNEPDLSQIEAFVFARGLEVKLGIPVNQPFGWTGPDDECHGIGHWWRAPLREPQPPLPRSFDYLHWTCAREQYEKAFHCSSLYSFAKIMFTGLRAGRATKQNLEGVYAFPAAGGRKVAINSSGYSVYSMIGGDGTYWTVKWELAVARFMGGWDGIGKITAGAEWVCKPGQFHVMAVWFHCVHQEDFARCRLWCAFDRWQPEYEQLPNRIEG